MKRSSILKSGSDHPQKIPLVNSPILIFSFKFSVQRRLYFSYFLCAKSNIEIKDSRRRTMQTDSLSMRVCTTFVWVLRLDCRPTFHCYLVSNISTCLDTIQNRWGRPWRKTKGGKETARGPNIKEKRLLLFLSPLPDCNPHTHFRQSCRLRHNSLLCCQFVRGRQRERLLTFPLGGPQCVRLFHRIIHSRQQLYNSLIVNKGPAQHELASYSMFHN